MIKCYLSLGGVPPGPPPFVIKLDLPLSGIPHPPASFTINLELDQKVNTVSSAVAPACKSIRYSRFATSQRIAMPATDKVLQVRYEPADRDGGNG